MVGRSRWPPPDGDSRTEGASKRSFPRLPSRRYLRYHVRRRGKACVGKISGGGGKERSVKNEGFVEGGFGSSFPFTPFPGWMFDKGPIPPRLTKDAKLAGDPSNRAAQAFSHFTFERSRGRFLVCDLQGVGNTMTDPAVHTLDPYRFSLSQTNLGVE
ncbi:kinase-like domain-containing protein [Pseudoneurospora amorphoporcata]|uniref:Kinase-like domain-containing protein n=1 Tax=Pseudoneurospora amorphoporcata TaxID=241081 RepID=A0AAN6P3A7_9PEZI|nr:kinase-like domain-containing protein [Pseudoneurospora amorphoporcata]